MRNGSARRSPDPTLAALRPGVRSRRLGLVRRDRLLLRAGARRAVAVAGGHRRALGGHRAGRAMAGPARHRDGRRAGTDIALRRRDPRGLLAHPGELLTRPESRVVPKSCNERRLRWPSIPKTPSTRSSDIATNAVEKASDIVEHASDIIRGDIAGGASGIVQNSIDIGTYAVDRTKEVFTGKDEVDDE